MADFNNEDLHKIHQLENELKEVKKELVDQLKAGGGAVGNDQAMMVKRLAQLEMDNRGRRFSCTLPPRNSDHKFVPQNGHKFTPDIDRRLRRNLPAELKVEIVDCFPVENAVHFLANVPNRLIIHHCAPRIRRILKMILQIAADYARTLPAPDYCQYTPEMDIFLRYGAAHCNQLSICWRDISDGFVGYPANFFDDLIKHCYETKVRAKAVRYVGIYLPWANPAPWPATLLQPGEMKLKEVEVNKSPEYVRYILYNKHNPRIAFRLNIFFGRNTKRYQQMNSFEMWHV